MSITQRRRETLTSNGSVLHISSSVANCIRIRTSPLPILTTFNLMLIRVNLGLV